MHCPFGLEDVAQSPKAKIGISKVMQYTRADDVIEALS